MKPISTDVRANSTARPSTVYAVARDSSCYPVWSQIGSFEHVRSGAGELYGVGSLRIFRTGPLKLLEEVVELEPERRIAYMLHSGLPFRDYRADIELSPLPNGGTAIRWHNSFRPKYVGTGLLCRAFMQSVLGAITPALAREAERMERENNLRPAARTNEAASTPFRSAELRVK